jgi:REP element-mobilizing transposase RayT
MERLVADSLDCMRLKPYAFAIVPDHLHLIIQCRAEDPLADDMRDLIVHMGVNR